MYLDAAKARFAELNITPPDKVVPCTPADIENREQELGTRLPAAYREFLLWMGRRAEGFMVGSDFYYSGIRHAKEDVIDLLAENNAPDRLPDDAIIVWFHQGYSVMFIRASEGEDPPVYWYMEGEHENRFVLHAPSFSQYLLEEIELHARLRDKHKPTSAVE